MSNYNDNTQNTSHLGNPLTSNAAFVPGELDRSQQQGGLGHHDQYQQTQNPVSSHEHHTPSSGHQSTGTGMNNNFQAVPSSNTAGMTNNFAAVPHQQHGHSGNHGSNEGLRSHEGHDLHNTHGTDKQEDGSVMDALNPKKGDGMHLPHKGNEEQDRKFEERHARSDDNFAYRTDPNHTNYEPQTHTALHTNQHGNLPSGATPLTQDPHHAGTRHNDGSAPFSSTTGGPHGDQSLLRDHNDSRHDSSVAGSTGAKGLSLNESRAHGSGPAYPDASHGDVPRHATHNTSDPNKRFDNPLKDGSTLQSGATNTHGSHGTTGAYGAPSSGVPGHGGHTGETLPGHNESNPLHKNKDHHDSTTGTHGTEGAHKPSMGEKLKGSVAVLTGKLSGDQEKVAEGQALKTGQPVHGAGGVGSGAHHAGSEPHGTGVGGALSEPGVGHNKEHGLGGHEGHQQHGSGVTGGTQMGALGAGTGGHELHGNQTIGGQQNTTGYQGVPPRA